MKNKGLAGIINEFTPELIGAVVVGVATYLAFDYLPIESVHHTFEDAARTNNIPDYYGEANDIKNSIRFYLSTFGVMCGFIGGGICSYFFKKT